MEFRKGRLAIDAVRRTHRIQGLYITAAPSSTTWQNGSRPPLSCSQRLRKCAGRLNRKYLEIRLGGCRYSRRTGRTNLQTIRPRRPSTQRENTWLGNSSLLGENVIESVAALKAQPGHDLQIIGSGNLIQSLQAASLIDEYNVWTFPVILGRGKRMFEATAKPGALRLVSTQASTTGVVMTTYVPAGNIPLGSLAQGSPSAKELDRRKKLAHEDR